MIKINTSTKVLNFQNVPFAIETEGGAKPVTVGDVIFTELTVQHEIPLRISWRLLPQFAQENKDIELSEPDADILRNVIEKAAQKPVEQRFNLVIYGKVLDMLDAK